jgi:ParB/RepB/Spo0J family partition protein
MVEKSKVDAPLEVIGVKQVAVGDLNANPHNPRMLFDKRPMDVLQESIRRVGILVPLTVYWDPQRQRYVILDGQRRWMSAQAIGLDTVPVNVVAEPTLVQNIVTMFQIHKLREDWELMPTALKVELLMKELNERNDKRLAVLTGLDEAVVSRCKKLVSYSRKFQDLMLDAQPERRLKADFFIELYAVIHDREVKSFDWFRETEFIESMLDKYQNEPRTIKSVTDFRLIKQHISNAKKGGVIRTFSRRLKKFVEKRDTQISYLDLDAASVAAEARALTKAMVKLDASVTAIAVDQLYGEEELWSAMSSLARSIDKKLREANKRR